MLGFLFFGRVVVDFYAEQAWFGSLGFAPRFWKLETARILAWVGVVSVASGILFAQLRSLGRSFGSIRVRHRLGDLEIAEALPPKMILAGEIVLAVGVGLLLAAPVAGDLGARALYALHAHPWGRPDEVLGRDPRFYVFTLPLLRGAWSVAFSLVVWSALLTTGLFLATGKLQAVGNGLKIDRGSRRRLVYLGAALLLVVAGHFALSIYEVVGAGPITYAAVYGTIPARRLLMILAASAAVALVFSELTERWNVALWAAVVLGVAWPLGTSIYPELIHRFRVEPNELELERPFIEANVNATRFAFGVENLKEEPYQVVSEAPPLAKLERWSASLPLWDERPLKATYNQLQGLLAYHEFPDVDNDRYRRPDGSMEQVAIAVREFSPGKLTASARTWQNLHLRYTHGQGLVVSPVDRTTNGGEPEYYARDLPARVSSGAPKALELTEPRIYFGELTTQYAVVSADSFARGDAPAGIDIARGGRRLVFAWALGSKNLFLRRLTGGRSILLWRREIVARVRALVPFLQVDPDPYPVVEAGRIQWVLNVYGVSRNFPLAQGTELDRRRVSYVRDAAKVVVDALTGRVTLYMLNDRDPLLATYRSTFPALFRPETEMPPWLRDHIRYPRSLLAVQARMLEAYHLVKAEDFYNKQNMWSLAKEVYQGHPAPVDPYYLVMPMPGSGADADEFLLTVPFTPRNRDNLAAFLIAESDAGSYGHLRLFRIASVRQVFGPRQVEVQIDQNPLISQQLSLWRQLGSRATRGHLLLVPVDGYLLYVEPLFLEAEDREGAAPGLKRVIVAGGDRVAMSETLDGSLRSLFGAGGAEVGEGGEQSVRDEGAARRPTTKDDLEERLREADAALRRGDLIGFGRLWNEIRDLIQAPGEGAGAARPEASRKAGAGE